MIRGVYSRFWASPEQPPHYSPDWADAGGRETFQEAANRYLSAVSLDSVRPANVLLFRYRKDCPAKHAGILISETQFLHAQHGAAVTLASLTPWWQRHIAFAFAFPADASSKFETNGTDQ